MRYGVLAFVIGASLPYCFRPQTGLGVVTIMSVLVALRLVNTIHLSKIAEGPPQSLRAGGEYFNHQLCSQAERIVEASFAY